MPLIPFAEKKLIPPGSNDPRITARVGILHVDDGNAFSLYDYFKNRSGGIESHGHIRKDGVLEQYRDTAYQADANYEANDFALSFESQGYGEGEWTAEQLATIKRVMLWAREVHGIPLRPVDRWDGFGWGYHTMFGAPGHWTPVAKSCPGPDRIRQFHEVLVPWMAEQNKPAKPSKPEPTKPDRPTKVVKAAHVSMRFSDTACDMEADADAIFTRATNRHIRWVTGTEAGEEPLKSILRAAAQAHGYRIYLNRGQWVAVDRDLIAGGWDSDYTPVLESTEGRGKHTDRGITWVSFDTADFGRLTVGAGHYLTDGRKPGDPNYLLNRRYSQTIGAWATEKGAESALVFYGGDQNINDRTDDTFHGAPMTSAWDELGRYENTGHGPIDVIASYNRDARVTAKAVRALDDDEFDLNTDHYLVVAAFEIRVAS